MANGITVQALAACKTKEDVNATVAELGKDYKTKLAEIRKAGVQRKKEIRLKELEPIERKAKKWKHGDKVYFAKDCKRDYFTMELQFVKGCRIKAGQWCRVWLYQPKRKTLWLCKPGANATRANVLSDSFSLTDIERHGIGRCEPKVREKSESVDLTELAKFF